MTFEGEVNLPWDSKSVFNSDSRRKHVERFLDEQQFYNILSIYDYSQNHREGQKPVLHYVAVYYKHNFNHKPCLKCYCVKDSWKRPESLIFSGIFYPPTETYVNWPGQLQYPRDHMPDNPLYCVIDWKSNTTPTHLTEEKFYTVFALKKSYHKLYCPTSGIKFICHPSEQKPKFELTSSVLFSKRQKAKVFRYKYNFLQESEDASTVVDLTHHDDVDDDCSAHSNETYSDFDSDDYFGNDNSDDTVCYDEESYYHSEIITQSSSHRNFFKSVSKMSRKLALEQSQLIKTLFL